MTQEENKSFIKYTLADILSLYLLSHLYKYKLILVGDVTHLVLVKIIFI